MVGSAGVAVCGLVLPTTRRWLWNQQSLILRRDLADLAGHRKHGLTLQHGRHVNHLIVKGKGLKAGEREKNSHNSQNITFFKLKKHELGHTDEACPKTEIT